MFSAAPMAPQQQGGAGDPAALAAELVAGGPEVVMPFLQALDEALGEHDADLKRLVLAMDKRDEDDEEEDDDEDEQSYEGGGASLAAMNAPAGLTEEAAPGGRTRISLR
jgi:hypothetical protein